MYATFNRFAIQMTKQQALSASHPGACDEDVKHLLTLSPIWRQLEKIPAEMIMAELKEYGAWDDIELLDIEQNKARIIWIAACNIRRGE